MNLILYLFISLSSNGEHIGTTDYIVYEKRKYFNNRSVMTKEEKIKEAQGDLFNKLSQKTSEYILRDEGQVSIYLL